MIKVAAHFLKNHIEPIVDKLSDIIWFCHEKGLPITEKSVRRAFNKIIESQLEIEMLRGIVSIAIAFIICLTTFMIIK